MSKQAEIREGIVEPICEACLPYFCFHLALPPKERLTACKPLREWVDRILKSESDMGVVLKVDRELLTININELYHQGLGGEWVRKDEGLVAVEPLIKGE